MVISRQHLVFGLSAAILLVTGAVFGYALQNVTQPQEPTLPPQVLQAAGATTGETMALATGQVGDEAEGLFILDYLTGDLQCWVISHRQGQFNSLFRYNVASDLGVEQGKKPDYVMVTGDVNFTGGGAANNVGRTVVYVADGNTGNVAAYGVPWNPVIGRQGGPQQGSLIRLHLGKARMAAIREAP